METVYLAIPLVPLLASAITGLFCMRISRPVAHWVTCLGVGMSFLLSVCVLVQALGADFEPYNGTVYTWMVVEGVRFEIGFLIDQLTAVMITVVTFVSLMVHIYTIGYMEGDPGYNRFFSYISLFTFSMLMLVMSNNFLQLFFGWEAVGLVSYLLIGFWYERPTAIYANLKAFLVNRVGDFGFLLGIAAILMYFGSLDYAEVFHAAPQHQTDTMEVFPGVPWAVMSVICILLFIGAMGKSAQVPLHVWLPDSMEGPTPISALIHAATMVTAGIFMVARMSPLFEYSDTALSVVLVIGAITALFMGIVGIVQNDIKRVVAYSTLSQLGYMTAALGASAYSAAIFHLMTHAFFKALLFLAAGSVIIAMHHEQDIRNMGGLRRYMPITWITFLIGSLALMGLPGSSGFYSKDAIIEGEHFSTIPGAGFAHFCLMAGVFVTAYYSTRLYFLVFHGKERMDEHTREHLHETKPVVTIPLILLAIPSVFIGYLTIEAMVFEGFFGASIFVLPEHDVLEQLRESFDGPLAFALHGLVTAPFWLMVAGAVAAWFAHVHRPEIADAVAERLGPVYRWITNKYGFDDFNDKVFAAGTRKAGGALWKGGDVGVIDGVMVNGTARMVGLIAATIRHLQSGYLYHYAFAMIIGLLVLLSWMLAR